MIKPTLQINWDNNCVVNQHNRLYLQRVKQLNFTHSSAEINIIEDDQTKNIDLASPVGSYQDNTVSPDNHYAYRVIVESEGVKYPSVPTNHMYVPDVKHDIGYEQGTPSRVMTYNINSSPRLHLDSSRLHGVSDQSNDVIRDARSLVRHNTIDHVRSVCVQGDPVFDSRHVGDHKRYICARTDIPYNQSRSTQHKNKTSMYPVVTDDVILPSATLFIAVYTEYSINTCVHIKTSNQHHVTWSTDKVSFTTPHGSQTHKRVSDTPWAVFMIKHDMNNVSLWENGVQVCVINHDNQRDTSFNWTPRSKIDLLGSTKHNCGFSELLLFDHVGDFDLINTVSHYLFDKYNISHTYIDPRDI